MKLNWWVVAFLGLLFYLFVVKAKEKEYPASEKEERQKEILRGV